MENMVKEERIALANCQVSAGLPGGCALSDKLYYAQFAGMDDAQIEAVVARAKGSESLPLIWEVSVGWIVA